MTLSELYANTKGWTARHIIQDEIAMAGKDSEATEYIFGKVGIWEARESTRPPTDVIDDSTQSLNRIANALESICDASIRWEASPMPNIDPKPYMLFRVDILK